MLGDVRTAHRLSRAHRRPRAVPASRRTRLQAAAGGDRDPRGVRRHAGPARRPARAARPAERLRYRQRGDARRDGCQPRRRSRRRRDGDGPGRPIDAAPDRARRRGHDQLVSPGRVAQRRAPSARGRRVRSGPEARRGAGGGVRYRACLPGCGGDARRRDDRRPRRRVAARDPRRVGRGGGRARHRRPLPEAAHPHPRRGRGAGRARREPGPPHGPRELALPPLVPRAQAVDRRGAARRDRPRPARDHLLRLPARRRRPPARPRAPAVHGAGAAPDDRGGADPPPRHDALPLRAACASWARARAARSPT